MTRWRTGCGASAAGCGASGALDFAGGTVVHITSGVSALVAAIVLGQRMGFGREPMAPHNLTFTVLGAGLLWFGWFGFNAGSALAADGLAASAFVVTNTAAAAAALGWMLAEWIAPRQAERARRGLRRGRRAGGDHAGLGLRRPLAAILIGSAAASSASWPCTSSEASATTTPRRLRRPRRGGTWGALATGLFASKAINAAGANGLFYGNPGQLVTQAVAVRRDLGLRLRRLRGSS